MWVRGLKLIVLIVLLRNNKSHPMWVRGLKRRIALLILVEIAVAPHVGAWIETKSASCLPFAC